MTKRETELQAMVEELVYAMHLWAADEDNMLHPEAWASFKAALAVASIPHTMTRDEECDERYRFSDPDWIERQYVTLAMRQDQEASSAAVREASQPHRTESEPGVPTPRQST